MPERFLRHGQAPTCDSLAMEPGAFTDVPVKGQFLIDLEFLTLCSEQGGVCVYANCPPYLKAMADQFFWLHFYAFNATGQEYSPDDPLWSDGMRTEGNVTTCAAPLTKQSARSMGTTLAGKPSVLVCHGEEPVRQMLLQILTRASFSLLDVGALPEDYLEGDLLLPLLVPTGKALSFLICERHAKARRYDERVWRQELAFFQSIVRESSDYDQQCIDAIITGFAERFKGQFSWLPLVTELNLKFLIESL